MSNISLRKAAAYSQALLAAAKELPLDRMATMSIYSTTTVKDKVAEAVKILETNAARASTLISAAFEIRRLISVRNSDTGINDLLAEKGELDAREKIISGLALKAAIAAADSDIDAAQARLDAMKERAAQASDRYGREETVLIQVISEEVAAKFADELAEIRLRKVAISDELLRINIGTEIAISQSTHDLLKELKVV